MISELTENKAKVVFISLVGAFFVILIIITYYIHFDNKTNDELNNTLIQLNKEIQNNKNRIENNKNRVNNNKKQLEKNENILQKNQNKLLSDIQEKEDILESINTETFYNNNDDEEREGGVEPNLLSNIKNGEYKKKTEQVYNLSNNIYTYDDARAACMAHGGKLATYEQVINAYKKGANWCNYGWSENQMALFPTQKHVWEKLQQDSESAGSCGEWGVNGGYFENKDTLFGANCYGIKPEPKDRERVKPRPASKRERDMLLKVERFKREMNDLTVSPFNANLWSEP